MQESNIWWAAGFYEGEGTVRVNRRKDRHRITFGLQIINCDKDALEQFMSGVGGKGRIAGPYGPYGVSKKQTYVWQCNKDEEAKQIARELLPMLSKRRKQQINDAIALADSTKTRN